MWLVVRPGNHIGFAVGQGWFSGLLLLIAEGIKNASISKPPTGGEDETNLVVFADFPNEVIEGLVHIDAFLSRRLDESAPQAFRKIATLCDHNGQQTPQRVRSLWREMTVRRERTVHSNLALGF